MVERKSYSPMLLIPVDYPYIRAIVGALRGRMRDQKICCTPVTCRLKEVEEAGFSQGVVREYEDFPPTRLCRLPASSLPGTEDVTGEAIIDNWPSVRWTRPDSSRPYLLENRTPRLKMGRMGLFLPLVAETNDELREAFRFLLEDVPDILLAQLSAYPKELNPRTNPLGVRFPEGLPQAALAELLSSSNRAIRELAITLPRPGHREYAAAPPPKRPGL